MATLEQGASNGRAARKRRTLHLGGGSLRTPISNTPSPGSCLLALSSDAPRTIKRHFWTWGQATVYNTPGKDPLLEATERLPSHWFLLEHSREMLSPRAQISSRSFSADRSPGFRAQIQYGLSCPQGFSLACGREPGSEDCSR